MNLETFKALDHRTKVLNGTPFAEKEYEKHKQLRDEAFAQLSDSEKETLKLERAELMGFNFDIDGLINFINLNKAKFKNLLTAIGV